VIYRTVGETSSFGGNPLEEHIGLGKNARATALDVWWPVSNTRQHFTGIAANQRIVIEEFASDYADEPRAAKGIVLKSEGHSLTVSCDAIPGYMEAMEMEFSLRTEKALKAGTAIRFSIVKRGETLYAEDIREGTTANFESEPMAAGQLTALQNIFKPSAKVLDVGEAVPDFGLTDQAGKTVRLAQFRGKVVALTFGYSRCPNPNYCFRLSSNLRKIEPRFRDLVLITIMIDPEHDQGATLAEYAKVFGADAAKWHFLTGPLRRIQEIAGWFGVNFWSVEGSLTHTLHTVILDRQGRVAVNLEGNRFTAGQLGDLVQTVMERE